MMKRVFCVLYQVQRRRLAGAALGYTTARETLILVGVDQSQNDEERVVGVVGGRLADQLMTEHISVVRLWQISLTRFTF